MGSVLAKRQDSARGPAAAVRPAIRQASYPPTTRNGMKKTRTFSTGGAGKMSAVELKKLLQFNNYGGARKGGTLKKD